MRPDFWVRSFAIVGDARRCLVEGVVVMRELVVWFEVVCGQILAKAGFLQCAALRRIEM
jgi:hypothetical protein